MVRSNPGKNLISQSLDHERESRPANQMTKERGVELVAGTARGSQPISHPAPRTQQAPAC